MDACGGCSGRMDNILASVKWIFVECGCVCGLGCKMHVEAVLNEWRVSELLCEGWCGS